MGVLSSKWSFVPNCDRPWAAIDLAELQATKDIYQIPKYKPGTDPKDKIYARPKVDKKRGFQDKGSHGKKAKQWHP